MADKLTIVLRTGQKVTVPATDELINLLYDEMEDGGLFPVEGCILRGSDILVVVRDGGAATFHD